MKMNYFNTNCYCGSIQSFEECCKQYICGSKVASTAEIVMRSRYSSYVIHDIAYLLATTHKSTRKLYSEKEMMIWATNNNWQKLEIIFANSTQVEFKAYYLDINLKDQIHHEVSSFIFENDHWFYVDGFYK